MHAGCCFDREDGVRRVLGAVLRQHVLQNKRAVRKVGYLGIVGKLHWGMNEVYQIRVRDGGQY